MTSHTSSTSLRLFSRSYNFMLAANFLLYFGFWLIIPVLPFYLRENYHVSNSAIGMALSCYTIASLSIRPFSGYLLDTFARKPLYLLAYFVFTLCFAGYMFATALGLFVVLRIFHGFSFGTVTVGGNTLVIDIMPSERRGEGLGYFGLTNNIAMALGPMCGLLLHNAGIPYLSIFSISLVSCLLGFLFASCVRSVNKPFVSREPISFDRFILINGLPAGLSLLLLSIPYGMTTNYVAMYAREIGITAETGFVFTLMAIGMAISRLFSGRMVDRGAITSTISLGMSLISLSYFLLVACEPLGTINMMLSSSMLFIVSLLLGIGFGTIFPAFNTLFVNLAPNSKRGTATSTYLTSWDVGIGMGMLIGGMLSEYASFMSAYFVGAILTVVAVFYFRFHVTPHYHQHKVR